MKNFNIEHILDIHHWNDSLFSFKTTKNNSLQFSNGHFIMIGLLFNDKPLMRAYSIASANHENKLEFFSIKIQDGALTSFLKNLKIGDPILIGRKSVGTLTIDHLKSGKHLYLFCTGTGLAPFLSIIKDPEVYKRFEKVILVHGVRLISDLAYASFIENELPKSELLGKIVQEKLIYYPTVTRQSFRNQGRITDLIEGSIFFEKIGLPGLDPKRDRVMICGSPSMLTDIRKILNHKQFLISSNDNERGDYVIERAFANKVVR